MNGNCVIGRYTPRTGTGRSRPRWPVSTTSERAIVTIRKLTTNTPSTTHVQFITINQFSHKF
jgi:hypothetical protein